VPNTRYVAIAFTCVHAPKDDYKVYWKEVGGSSFFLLSRVRHIWTAGLEDTTTYNTYAYIFDIGAEYANVEIKVEAVSIGEAHEWFVDWIVGFRATDTFRNVLCVTPPAWNFSEFPDASYSELMNVRSAVEDAVETCKAVGLPVFLHHIKGVPLNWQDENSGMVHVNLESHIAIALQLKSIMNYPS
jgi:hypothetical protein